MVPGTDSGPTGNQQSRIFKIAESHESLNQIHMTQFFCSAKPASAWFSLINADNIKRNMGGFDVEMESTSQKVTQMQQSFSSIQHKLIQVTGNIPVDSEWEGGLYDKSQRQ